MTDRYDVYEAEGELLDSALLAAVNERPFYMQKQLDDLTDQVRLLDHITEEAQEEYFRPTGTQRIRLGNIEGTATEEWRRRHL